jgi:hypothetical protein
MMTADLNFEEYVNSEKSAEENGPTKPISIFERIANPTVDFLTGSQILENQEALSAAQSAGNQKAQAYGCHVKWRGTIGTVYKGDQVVEITEIHGMAWDRVNKKAHGLRMDLTLSKINGEGGSARKP